MDAAGAIIEALKAPNLTHEQRLGLLAALQALEVSPAPSKTGRKVVQRKTERRADSVRLTRESIAAMPLPETGERLVYDETCPQLAVRLRPGGRSYIVIVWDRTRQRKASKTLGKVEALTPEQARRKAQVLVAEVADGKDVRAVAAAGLSLGDLIRMWHAEKSKSCRTADEMRDKVLDYLGRLVHAQAIEVRRDQVGAIHHHIATAARRRVHKTVDGEVQRVEIGVPGLPQTADKWLAIMGSVYSWAFKKGLVQANPCTRFDKATDAKATARTTYLHGDALTRFWRALHGDADADARDVLLLGLFTSQRKGNVLAMRWAHVDLDAGLWTIPGDETKQRRAQVNPLNAQAQKVLRHRDHDAAGEWVFPAAYGTGCMSESRPRAAWQRICEAAGIEDVRIHDLRHTGGSWLARLGANEAVRQKALGHQTAAMAARYSHLELAPIADAMERMGDAIEKAAKGPARRRR